MARAKEPCPTTRGAPDDAAPRGDGRVEVWALLGDKAGDNAQVLALSHALGGSTVPKPLRYNGRRLAPNWILGGSRVTLTNESKNTLRAPWPRAVVAVGRRSAPVARWIQRQSGGWTRLIHLGRPRAPLSWFDLVLTTPQYGLPRRRNVVHLELPFQNAQLPVDDGSAVSLDLSAAGALTTVLVGGDIAPYRFDARTVAELANELLGALSHWGGELGVACGRRLPARAADALQAALGASCSVFHAVSRGDEGNPYRALLGRADRFVVTTDSVSMMSDAMATGRPVFLFTANRRSPGWWKALDLIPRTLSRACPRFVTDALVARGVVVPPRRTPLIAEGLVKSGRASWLARPLEHPHAAPAVNEPAWLASARRLIEEPVENSTTFRSPS